MAEEHIKTQVLAAAPAVYGGFWIRFLAYFVDALILVVGCVLVAALGALAGDAFALLVTLLIVFGPFLYFAAMHASARQATYGKALVGLKVAGMGGGRISFPRSLGRELAKIISSIPFMVGFLLAAFTSRKQALHDMVAATVVVRERPGHVAAAVAITLVGVAAPFVVVVVFGAAILMAFMGGMAGGMLGDMAMQAPPPKPPATQMARPAPSKPAPPAPPAAPPAPQAKPPAPAPAAPVALSAEDEKLFGGGVAGMDAPGMKRAGPALLELSSFFSNGPNVWIKVHVPPVAGMGLGRGRATVVVKSVTDPGGREVYDAKSNFEQPFFQAIDLAETKSGVARLQGIRSVRLLKGTTEAQVHKVQGVLSLALPLDIQTGTFRAADVGKGQKVAGLSVVASKLAGGEATVALEGATEHLLDVRGFDAKGPVAREGTSYGSSGGKAERQVKFKSPVERIEVLVAPRFLKRDYPFTLVRGEMPAPLPPSALAAAPKPRTPEPKVPEKPAAPAVAVAKVTAPPPAPPSAPKAPPPPSVAPAPVAKTSPVVVPIARGPSVPGPKYADLMTAVMYRDAAAVEELLAFGKWPDKPDSRGLTPLAAAVMLGDTATAEALLKGGADPDGAWRVLNELNDPAMRALVDRYRK